MDQMSTGESPVFPIFTKIAPQIHNGGEGGIERLRLSIRAFLSLRGRGSNPHSTKNMMAERGGFEPPVRSRAHLISNQAPSTTRTPLQDHVRSQNLQQLPANLNALAGFSLVICELP